jgi:acetyl-CoA carboxylase biotin carboxyl carrier protein
MEESKYKEITELLKLFEHSELTDMLVEFDGVRLSVSKKDGALVTAPWEERVPAAPLAPDQPASPAVSAPKPSAPDGADQRSLEGLHVVRAPMLGTLYRKPSPGEPPFVVEGSQVKADDTLCLIECMKLFNTVAVGTTGRLVRFAVEDSAMVEFGQPIAYVELD